MTVAELINVLNTYDPTIEVFACSDEELWQINPGAMRETTLQNTENGDVVEPEEYDEEDDGKILGEYKALLIDLEL